MQPVAVYVFVVFLLTWVLDFFLWRAGGLSNANLFHLMAALQMFIPAVVAIVFRRWVTREGFAHTGLRLGKKRYYAIAFFLMVGFVLVACGISALTPWGHLDTHLEKVQALMAQMAARTGKPVPFGPGVLLAIIGLQAVVLGPVLGIPATFGEEYGWRGYLLPRLLPLGKAKALVLHAVIWGLWHAPIIAMGYNYPGRPVLGIGMMTLFCVLVGAVYAWLYYASGSIWVTSLAHGTLNQTASFALMFLGTFDAFLAGPLGLPGLGLLALIVVTIAWRGGFRVIDANALS